MGPLCVQQSGYADKHTNVALSLREQLDPTERGGNLNARTFRRTAAAPLTAPTPPVRCWET